MFTKFSLVLSGFLLSCSASHAAEVPSINAARVVALDAVIVDMNVMALLEPIEKMLQDNKDPIDIIISSPGGDVLTGSFFINELEAFKLRGATFRCFVPAMAASMAFQILVHCDERYTLNRSVLLWHRVRVGLGDQPLTGPMARVLARDLAQTDRMFLEELFDNLGMSEGVVRYHFDAETLHFGENLARIAPGFIESFPAIPGLMEAWRSPKTPRIPKPKSLLDLLMGEGRIRIIYIYEGKK